MNCFALVVYEFFRPGSRNSAFSVSAAFDMTQDEAEERARLRGYPWEEGMIVKRREEPVHVG